jgi:hypothetical protein
MGWFSLRCHSYPYRMAPKCQDIGHVWHLYDPGSLIPAIHYVATIKRTRELANQDGRLDIIQWAIGPAMKICGLMKIREVAAARAATKSQNLGPIMVHLFVRRVPLRGFGPSVSRSFNQLPQGVSLSLR